LNLFRCIPDLCLYAIYHAQALLECAGASQGPHDIQHSVQSTNVKRKWLT
jgi:hypothetical protein